MLKPLGAGIAGPLQSTPGMGLTQQRQEHPGLALPGCQRLHLGEPHPCPCCYCRICPILSLPSTCSPGSTEGGMAWPSRALKAKGKLKCVEEDLDDSLPDLMWLRDFTVAQTGLPQLYSGSDPQDCYTMSESLFSLVDFESPCSPLAADPACKGTPHTPCTPVSSSTSSTTHHDLAVSPHLAGDIDYKTNPHVKPPYSYATLICMAMEASNKPKITLSAIYKWITDNFCYFRHADPTWQVGDVEPWPLSLQG